MIITNNQSNAVTTALSEDSFLLLIQSATEDIFFRYSLNSYLKTELKEIIVTDAVEWSETDCWIVSFWMNGAEAFLKYNLN